MSDTIDYARRGHNAWWRYLVCVLLAIVVMFALALAIDFLPHGQRLLIAATQPSDPIAFFLGIGFEFGLVAVSLAAAAALIHKKSPADIVGRWSGKLFGAGLAIQAVCLILSSVVDFLVHPNGFRWTANGEFIPFAAAATVGLAIQTFGEEFIFRGYATQGLFLAIKRPWVASVVSGLVFGAAHYANGGPECAEAVMFGIAAARIAIRTRGLAFTYGAHLINNLFGAVVVVSASDVFKGTPGLITETLTPGLMWWGVAFEALMLAAVTWLVLKRTDPAAERV